MKLVPVDNKDRLVVIAGSAAGIVIRPGSDVQKDGNGWVVEWKVTEHTAYDQTSTGRRYFTDKELAAAFGLSDDSGAFGQHIIDQYGADCAEQGKYIRWRNFINIPCPGTGHDGDPNVSIQLDEQMKAAVQRLLHNP